MAEFWVTPLIGKGDSIDNPIRPVVRGNFTMASNPDRGLRRAIILSSEMPQGAREAQDKDFEEFGVKRGRVRLKEK